MRIPTAIAAAAIMLATLSGCSYFRSEPPEAPPPSSGSSTAPINESQARQILQDEGYANISNLHQTDNGWQASAMRNGQSTTVGVDNYGIVHTQ